MKKILLVALMFFMATQANATLMSAHSFTGNFDNDESRFYIQFDVTDTATISFLSHSYAGGVNAAGTTVADGGFDPQLFIFDAASTLLQSDDDSSTVVSASSGNAWDSYISLVLNAGSYTAVLTQFNSDFLSGDLVTGEWTMSNQNNFNGRTSFYSFDISGENLANVGGIGVGTTPTPVSEPTTLAILALGLLGFAGRRFSK
ncbi:DVUA0089 family protein [Colwellia asteriadis]|uniref:DVUA0089 family protein n=1 Tax=Colwellia asteriadis TaxID=517723 RepID=A0ABP3WF02_9GAMM